MNWKPTSDTTALVKAFDAKQDLLLFWMFNDALIESGSPMDAWGMLFMLSGNINGDDVLQGYQTNYRSTMIWRPDENTENGRLEEIEGDAEYIGIMRDYGDAVGYEHMNWNLISEMGVSFENALHPSGSGLHFFYNMNLPINCGRGNGRNY